MEKKEEILKLLNKEGKISFSRICGLLGINKYYGERYLVELVKEGKISLIQEDKTKYFEIKEQ